MNSKFIEYSEEESIKYNGQAVMSVLTHLGDAATADKICDEIVHMSNQPKDVVEPEVKRILRRGVNNGFLVKFGKNYLLSGAGSSSVEVDSKRKTYKNINARVSQRKRNIKTVGKSTEHEQDDDIGVRNISLKLDQNDSVDNNNQFVLLKPKEAVNAIINDLYKMVQTPEDTSEDEYQVIDLEAIISRNLNGVSKPYNDASEKE